MNILIMTDIQKNRFGGGRYSVFKFGEYLARIGNKVSVFWIAHPDLFREAHTVSNFNIRRRIAFAGTFKGSSRIDVIVEKTYDAIFLYKFINTYRGEIDYIMGHQIDSAVKAVKYGERFRIKTANFIFETPEWLSLKLGDTGLKEWKYSEERRRWDNFKESLKKSDLIFPSSWATRKYAEKWLEEAIAEPIFPGFQSPRLYKNIAQNKNKILYIGRLSKSKNVNEIIEALSSIPSPPNLVICGVGSERGNLEKLTRKLRVKCEFKGSISDEEKWKLISESKFMVFPTSFEGFGIPPMEALAMGVPCLCSNIPILKDVYKGYVEYFEEHNVTQLAEKIRFLLENPEYCKKRGEEGRKYVNNIYSWKKSAENIERVLRENLSRRFNSNC